MRTKGSVIRGVVCLMRSANFLAGYCLAFVLSGILFACAAQSRPVAPDPSGQSYADAIRQICEVDRLLAVSEEMSEFDRKRNRTDFILENTKNGDALFFVTVFRTKSPEQQAQMLKREANAQGVLDCALAKSLESETD